MPASMSRFPAITLFSLLLFFAALPRLSLAQLAAPNAMGTAMGHIHTMAADLEGAREFWEIMGGTPVQNGPLSMVNIPGVLVLIREGEASGGTVGTVINHVGFHVPDVPAAAVRWRAAGLDVEDGGFPGQIWINGPDGLRIEILQNADINGSIQFHHVHWNVDAENIPAMQAWYDEMFGATPGMRGNFQAGDIPGANLTYGGTEVPVTPIRGTALDHIGFEVTDLRATIARLEANGTVMDSGYRDIPNTNLAIAFFTDPWGTYVELTQGLEP